MNEKQTLTIHDFMLSDLKLNSNELLVYAIIYDATNERGLYDSGTAYLSTKLNLSRPYVFTILKKLVEKNLISKIDKSESVKIVSYKTNIETKGE